LGTPNKIIAQVQELKG
ncbi:D-alanine--poly(phosphoribitol) ligase subunit 2, partial [Enterococcus durans]